MTQMDYLFLNLFDTSFLSAPTRPRRHCIHFYTWILSHNSLGSKSFAIFFIMQCHFREYLIPRDLGLFAHTHHEYVFYLAYVFAIPKYVCKNLISFHTHVILSFFLRIFCIFFFKFFFQGSN